MPRADTEANAPLSADLGVTDDSEEAWQFNEAPHWMRVLGVEHIPTLIEKMVAETNETAK